MRKELEIPLVPTASAPMAGLLDFGDRAKPLVGQRIEYVMEMKFPGGAKLYFHLAIFSGSTTSDERGRIHADRAPDRRRLQDSARGARPIAPKREKSHFSAHCKQERAGVIELGDVNGEGD